MKIIRYFLIVIMLLVSILFTSLNAELVDIDLYFHVYHWPLSLLLVLIFGLGIFMGYIMGRFKRYFSKR